MTKARDCAGLCTWVAAMARFHDVDKDVEPLRVALREAEDKLSIAETKLQGMSVYVCMKCEELCFVYFLILNIYSLLLFFPHILLFNI